MVGKLPEPERAPGIAFQEEGHAIALLGPFRPSLSGSEHEKLRGALSDSLPSPELTEQADALVELRAAVREDGIASAHDVSEGGLACALAESCLAGELGAKVDLTELFDDPEAALFGEGPGGVVLSGPREILDSMEGARVIGEVGGEEVELTTSAGTLSVAVERAREAYERAIPDRFS
jgi:phosphoribosylformylglycinamidine synthase